MTRKQAEEQPAEIPGPGRWWRRPARSEPLYAGLGERVMKILRLAEEESRALREDAVRAAAVIIERAEQDAARIRADAEAEARAIHARADEQRP
jgi:cell division septum initiation protein DivIVA